MKKLRRKFYLWLQKRQGREAEQFTVHGVQVHIPVTADFNIRYLLARGRPYEAPEARLIKAHLPRGSDVIELGGCMGVISAVIRDRVGPEARHIVVEADAGLAQICMVNAEAGAEAGKTQVVVAAVDYSGAKTVSFASGKNAHVGHLAAEGEDGAAVPTTTLSALAAQIGEGPFSVVCDIEGAEIAMFENEAALMDRVQVIILETHPKFYDGGAEAEAKLLALLESYGMTLVARDDNVVCLLRLKPTP
ncbi:MAG: FkbM family methyltransferase [Rhodobacteraceae bacterium]|nr:FkbM family methyltransferase [Paracoccaceae bacterium]